jgi:solute carrier family 35 protein
VIVCDVLCGVGQVTLAVIGYSLCSSTLLLANKLAVSYLPIPSVINLVQIMSSALIVSGMKLLGLPVNDFEWSKVRAFALYIIAFVTAIYANMQALAHSNVETIIVFRACTPIAVCMIEYFLWTAHFPS